MDLHIHTCLSPCGDLEMLPSRIVKKAKSRGLDAIGICDHNTAENVAVVKRAGAREDLAVIGGIEITSRDEVHMLALFDSDADLRRMQDVVYEHLPGTNDEDAFGEQLIADEDDGIVGINGRLLIGATTLFVEQVLENVHKSGGLAIASYIDRETFSIISQLGFIPDGLDIAGLEVSPLTPIAAIGTKLPGVNDFPLVSFSDAHYLQDIGRTRTAFFVEQARVDEIHRALLNREGRRVEAS